MAGRRAHSSSNKSASAVSRPTADAAPSVNVAHKHWNVQMSHVEALIEWMHKRFPNDPLCPRMQARALWFEQLWSFTPAQLRKPCDLMLLIRRPLLLPQFKRVILTDILIEQLAKPGFLRLTNKEWYAPPPTKEEAKEEGSTADWLKEYEQCQDDQSR